MNYSKIGERLKLVRERKGLSYEQIFEITKIQPSILRDIEEGQVSVSPVFLKGFIKTYARSLGLDAVALFQLNETEDEKKDNARKEVKAKKEHGGKNKKRNYLKYLFLLFGFFIIFQVVWFMDISTKNNGENVVVEKNKKNPSAEGLIENTNSKTQENTTIEIQDKDEPEDDKTLFHQIKKSVFKKDLLIKSTEPLEMYFKVDKRSTVTKRLEPSVWFHIKAKESIYLRFDENRGHIQIFYNGKQVDTGNKKFFERTFQ